MLLFVEDEVTHTREVRGRSYLVFSGPKLLVSNDRTGKLCQLPKCKKVAYELRVK